VNIVAISMELGSEAREIGKRVAGALGYRLIEREVLLQAAEKYAVKEETLAQVDERTLSFWEKFDEDKRRYRIFIESALLSFARDGRVVIAGRGSPLLLKEIDHALKVRIVAPLEVRVERIMAREDLDHRTATLRVKAHDKEQATRSEYFFGVDWARPEHYDLVVNTGRGSLEAAADLMVYAARMPLYQPTEASRQKIRDLSLACEVEAALAADPAVGNLHVEVSASSGIVTLKGVVFSPATMEAAAAVAKRAEGVVSVNCEVVEVPRIYPGPMM
jgi:cytidylate kinase